MRWSGSDLPIVGGFRAKGRAEGFRVLTRIRQGRQRSAFAEAVKANEGILETRRRADAQAALLPVVAPRHEHVEVAPGSVSPGGALERGAAVSYPLQPSDDRGVQVEPAAKDGGIDAQAFRRLPRCCSR